MLVALLIFSSCSNSTPDQTKAERSVEVTVENPVSLQNSGYFSTSGKIEADKQANISTRVMGFVNAVHVNVGDKVRKGQQLVDISNTELEAKKAQAVSGIKQAESLFLSASKDLDRYRVLYEQKSASQKEFDDIQTRYNIAEAQLESARQAQREVEAMLTYTNLRAPFAGIITSKFINSGDLAKPGQPLLSMEAPGDFVAVAMVPESYISGIHQKDSARVIVKSNREQLKGIISEISTSSSNSGGQYLVKINLLPTKTTHLYSGMFVAAEFSSDQVKKSRILIEKSALIKKGDLSGVYTVSNSETAVLRWLKLGREVGDRIEVLSGLSAGEPYILNARGKLYNGVQLKIK